MYASKHSLNNGSPPPCKRVRRVSGMDDTWNSTTAVVHHGQPERCEYSAQECRQLLQSKDTMSEALDALLQYPELRMHYARIHGAYFYLTYALTHASKDTPELCEKVFDVMTHLVVSVPHATGALRTAGATTHIPQAMHRHPHRLDAAGNALLQAMGQSTGPRRVTLDESSMRYNAMAASQW